MSVVELAQLYPGTVLASMMIGAVVGFLSGLLVLTFSYRGMPRVKVRFDDYDNPGN